MEPEKIKTVFLGSQYLLGGLLLLVIYFFARPKGDSQFRSRETDNQKDKKNNSDPKVGTKPGLADAKYKPRPEPLKLAGIVLDSPPHILLKVKETASEAEIQKAFKELIKQYHPDRVGRPGTREWQDAQAIADALNRARNQMLEKIKSGR